MKNTSSYFLRFVSLLGEERKRMFMLVGLAVMSLNALSQLDPRFLQPGLTPLEVNPGFAGLQPGTELNACHLSQWPSLSSGGFQTSFLALNVRPGGSPVGLGLTTTQDVAGGTTTTNSAKVMAAYGLPLGEQSELRMGLSVGAFKSFMDTEGLIFAEPEPGLLNQIQYVSLSGGMLFTTSRLTLGGAAWHVNEPSNTFLVGGNSTKDIRFQTHAAYDFPVIVTEEGAMLLSISPSVQQRWQDQSMLTFVGVYANILYQFRLGAMTMASALSGGPTDIVNWGGSAGVRLGEVWLNYTYGQEVVFASAGASHQLNVQLSLGDLWKNRVQDGDDAGQEE